MEESSEIQELSKYKPHVLLTQENTQIKELQQENRGKTQFICFNHCNILFYPTLSQSNVIRCQMFAAREKHQLLIYYTNVCVIYLRHRYDR